MEDHVVYEIHYDYRIIYINYNQSLNQRYVVLLSRSMFFAVSILFLNTWFSAMIDLESLKYICMHPIRSKHGNGVIRGS